MTLKTISSSPKLSITAAVVAVICQSATLPVFAADADNKNKTASTLKKVVVTEKQEAGLTPGTLTTITKGEARPLTTPQSITVVTRELMDSRQDKSLMDAIGSVAGVVAGERGNRGFDDFGIRGMTFGQEKYVDGLSTVRQGYVPAEELFGAERVEVLKGPASLLFGNVRPGGMVNVVSKRPKPDAATSLNLTLGNYGFKQLAADINQPLASEGRTGFRAVALTNESDDVIDHVWFKNRYIAPSLSIALGEDTDLTLLTSYHEREWVRLQGLPPKGTVLPNRHGTVPRSFYAGVPDFGNNDFERTRIGYALQHRFSDDWTLQQNFRWDDYVLHQHATAFLGVLAADERTQSRTGNIQDDDHQTVALDTYLSGKLEGPLGTHALTAGIDLNDKQGQLVSRACTSADLGTIDLFAPQYGQTPRCTGAVGDNVQDIDAAGFYLRDRIELTDALFLTAGARHDRVQTRTFDNIKSAISSNPKDSATTGMLGVSWEMSTGVAPYVSWADSFVPVSGTDAAGLAFEPESGKQLEAGVKFERDGGQQIASIAVYDLKRQNVTTPDPLNPGFNVQQGEHRSRGLEIETAAKVSDELSLTAAYAYTDAEVTRSNIAKEVGKTVNNVPKHSANLWSLYQLSPDLQLGLGVRHVDERTGYSYDFTIPGYTVFDAAVQYQLGHWRAALNVRNLADKTIYGGALSNNVLTLGEVRTMRLNLAYEF